MTSYAQSHVRISFPQQSSPWRYKLIISFTFTQVDSMHFAGQNIILSAASFFIIVLQNWWKQMLNRSALCATQPQDISLN